MRELSRRPLVVGIDDTTAGQIAVRWAVEEAQRRSRPLRIISAYDARLPTEFGQVAGGKRPPPVLQDRFDDAVAYAADRLGRDRVEGYLLPGRASDLLVRESSAAELVIVGSRSHTAFGAAVMGSVGSAIAAHAACSVVVARAPVEPTRPRVVVGVDRPEEADAALASAFEAAESRRLPLEVVHCWQPYVYFDQVPMDQDVVAEERRRRGDWLAEKTAAQSEKHPDVPVTTHLVQGRPGDELAQRSTEAVLLVVGSHGRSAVSGLLLGSVSQHVLRHARCTVMVARDTRR